MRNSGVWRAITAELSTERSKDILSRALKPVPPTETWAYCLRRYDRSPLLRLRVNGYTGHLEAVPCALYGEIAATLFVKEADNRLAQRALNQGWLNETRRARAFQDGSPDPGAADGGDRPTPAPVRPTPALAPAEERAARLTPPEGSKQGDAAPQTGKDSAEPQDSAEPNAQVNRPEEALRPPPVKPPGKGEPGKGGAGTAKAAGNADAGKGGAGKGGEPGKAVGKGAGKGAGKGGTPEVDFQSVNAEEVRKQLRGDLG